jgi:hypothetical protein
MLSDGNVLAVDVPNIDLCAQLKNGQADGHRPDVDDGRTVGSPPAVVVSLATAFAAFVDNRSLKVLVERRKRDSVPTILQGEE